MNQERTLYHVRHRDILEGKAYKAKKWKVNPRIPSNRMDGEDDSTPRICFAPSIEKCLLGITGYGSICRYSLNDCRLSAYAYTSDQWVKPTEEQVPDQHITDEHWLTSPCTMRYIGVVEWIGDLASTEFYVKGTTDEGHHFCYVDLF